MPKERSLILFSNYVNNVKVVNHKYSRHKIVTFSAHKIGNMKKKNIYNTNFELIIKLAIVFLIYQFCRIGFYLFNTDLFTSITTIKLAKYALTGLRFDLSAILYTNALFLLLSLLPFKFTFNTMYKKVANWVFYICNSIAISANVSDFIYYRFTNRRTTASVFDFMTGESNIYKLWGQFFIDYWYVAIVGISFIGLLIYLTKKVPKPQIHIQNHVWHFVSRLVVMALFGGLTIAGMRGGFLHSTRPITLSNAGKYVDAPEDVAVVLNTPFCILRTIGKTSIKHQSFYNEDTLRSIYTPLHIPQADVLPTYKNVIVIILESFAKEHSGFLNRDLDNGTYKGYTPFLDSLMQQSLVFDYSYANGSKSIDALPSVMSSIPSLEVSYLLSPYSTNKVFSLPKLLKDEGYHTSFFHGAPNGSMGFQAFCNTIGIEKYYGKTEYNNDADYDGIWGIWDEPFLQYMVKEVSHFKEPFFTSVFTLSSHHPFKVPTDYEGKFPKGHLPVHQCVGYTDMALRKFYKTASKQPWFKNTLFVFTADHSTVPYHTNYKTLEKRYSIPIFFHTPDSKLTEQRNEVVQQIDIMPSVLGYLNYNKPYVAFGNDVFHRKDKGWAITFPNGIYQLIGPKYLLQHTVKEPIAFYDKNINPMLNTNLLSDTLIEQKKMKRQIKAIIQQYHNRMLEDKLTTQE